MNSEKLDSGQGLKRGNEEDSYPNSAKVIRVVSDVKSVVYRRSIQRVCTYRNYSEVPKIPENMEFYELFSLVFYFSGP